MLIAAVAACLPGVAARGQGGPGTPVVGFLGAAERAQEIVRLLGELGWAEGRNLRVEAEAAGNLRAIPGAALALIRRQPHVLVAEGPAVVALAAYTQAIPIVCGGLADPVGSGLAKSLERPGGNVTGLSTGSPDTAPIAFGLLKQMRPGAKRIAVFHSEGAPVQVQMRSHKEAAEAAGLEWHPVQIDSIDDAERAVPRFAGEAAWFASIATRRVWHPTLQLAHRHRIATIGAYPGTLMWHSRVFTDAPRRVAAIVDKVLRGAKPADIPFELPDRTVLTLNRGAARAVGIEIPPELLLRATEVVD